MRKEYYVWTDPEFKIIHINYSSGSYHLLEDVIQYVSKLISRRVTIVNDRWLSLLDLFDENVKKYKHFALYISKRLYGYIISIVFPIDSTLYCYVLTISKYFIRIRIESPLRLFKVDYHANGLSYHNMGYRYVKHYSRTIFRKDVEYSSILLKVLHILKKVEKLVNSRKLVKYYNVEETKWNEIPFLLDGTIKNIVHEILRMMNAGDSEQ